MLFMEIEKLESVSRRPYWIYAFYRDGKIRIQLPGGDIEIMPFIVVEEKEFLGAHIDIMLL